MSRIPHRYKRGRGWHSQIVSWTMNHAFHYLVSPHFPFPPLSLSSLSTQLLSPRLILSIPSFLHIPLSFPFLTPFHGVLEHHPRSL